MGPLRLVGRERWARLWIGVYFLATLAAVSGWLLVRTGQRPLFWLDLLFGLFNIPVAPSLVSAVVCGLVAGALLRRKAVGLLAAAFWQVAGIYLGIAQLVSWPTWDRVHSWWSTRDVSAVSDIASVPIGLVLLVLLWRTRRAFPAQVRPGSWLRSAAVLAAGLAATATASAILLEASGLPPELIVQQAPEILARLLGVQSRPADPGALPPWLPQLVSAASALVLLAAIVVFLRTARDPHAWTGDQEVALRALVARDGEDDSLAYFATRRDKAVIFTPDRRAAITYRVVRGVSLASADPIGDPTAWRDAISAWLAEARGYGWFPAVIGASAAGARAYAAAGLGVSYLGDEAVLDAAAFAPNDHALVPVLRAARHAAASGLEVDIRRQSELDRAELAARSTLAARWRSGDERGFSMALGRAGDPSDGGVVHVAARRPDGGIVALLTLVPWGRRGLSLDLMRRSPDAPNGVNELMVTELLRRSRSFGIRRVSLNFCMFRRSIAESAEFGSAGPSRLNHSLLGLFDRFWQLERLYRSNRRYHPAWSPRYLCFGDPLTLLQVALATALAEGFLGRPRRRGEPRARTLSRAQLEAAERVAESGSQPPAVSRTPRQRVRLDRLAAITAAGDDPYPPATQRPTASLAGALATAGPVTVVGRVARLRDHGGVVFVDLVDGLTGVQCVWDSGMLGDAELDRFRRRTDVGDLLLVTGVPDESRNGTRSLLVASWSHAAKALRPPPDARWGDARGRARRRTDELLVHPAAADVLRARSRAVRALRRTLDEAGFLEVETPILQTVHGGASARPFRTHANAAGIDLSLRIAPELYLKRLVVAGLGPIYEIGRNFRNEGMDAAHSPEFTALEAYRPFADYDDMRLLTQDLVRAAAVAVHGRPVLRPAAQRDDEIDLSGDWPVIAVLEAVSTAVGESVDPDTPIDRLRALAETHGVQLPDRSGAGRIIEELYGRLVEPRTISPTFFRDFPAETSPLTRPHRRDARLAERWDLVVGGRELGTAYTELADPVEQRRRLGEQSLQAAAGDPEAMELDEDFLAALELGMPPTGGLGIGVDRLVMALTGQPIRGVLSFPLVRPDIRPDPRGPRTRDVREPPR